MEKMLINERFKSPNKEFEKVYAIFDKRDYFNNKGLAKTQIGNFKRALEKNDKGAQKLLDAHKGNMDSAISYIEEFIADGNKRKSFESFQEFSSMVNALEMSTKPNLKQKPAEFIKRRIHNNSQKYTIALYSAIRKQKFNNYKDVHKDVDELVSKNESVNEAQVVNKKTGKDITRHVLDLLSGKIDKKKFEKLTGLKKESVDEGVEPQIKKIAYYTGTRPEAVEDFVSKHALNITKLLKYVQKGGLPQRMELVSALAGKPNNPKQKKIIKTFQESKGEVEQIAKKTKSETAFYDVLSTIEKKLGKNKYRIWLEKSLKSFGENPKHYDYRTNASIEEKLFQVTK
jgi:hypothetical protein